LPFLGKKEFTLGFFKALRQLPELISKRKRDWVKNPVYPNRQLLNSFSLIREDRGINIVDKEKDKVLRARPDVYNTQFIEAMATYHFIKELINGKRVLDAGCGFGYGTDYLAKWAKEAVGVDRSWEAIDWARKNYPAKNIKFMVSDITEINLADGYFDTVCLLETVHQVKEYPKLLAEMHRLLKKDGLFLVSTRHRKLGLSPSFSSADHGFLPQELKEAVLKSGFKEIEMYGLSRPPEVSHLESELKKLKKADALGIKNLVPRRLRPFLIYIFSKIKGITPPQQLNFESFKISKDNIETSPGFLIICKKI